MKKASTTLNENYAKFRANPNRIDGAIQNTAVARAGAAFSWSAMQAVPAVEIAFNNEPLGTTRYLMVVDMEAAKALRDSLKEILGSK